MFSIDTNILFHAFNEDSPSHKAAYAWLTSIQNEEEVAISEFILAELYGLLRNPAVLKYPLDADEAVEVIQTYRRLHDARAALTMSAQGVTEFATVNAKDYEGLEFRKVWNPLVA